MGKVRLFLLILSISSTASKSNLNTKVAMIWTATNSAIFFPKQVLGPPLKTGYSNAGFEIKLPFSSQRSGINLSEFWPHINLDLFIAQVHQTRTALLGR